MKRGWIAIVCVLAVGGCVERELKITSEPEGALVFISDLEVGRTPLTRPFAWYGDYDIILRLDGHKTLKTHAEINPPWYEIPPLDLLSQVAPWTYYDRRFLHYKLEKLVLPSDEEVIKRAKAHPEVLEIMSVTGEGSHLLHVRTRNTATLEQLLGQIQSWPGITRTETRIILSTYKERGIIRVPDTMIKQP